MIISDFPKHNVSGTGVVHRKDVVNAEWPVGTYYIPVDREPSDPGASEAHWELVSAMSTLVEYGSARELRMTRPARIASRDVLAPILFRKGEGDALSRSLGTQSLFLYSGVNVILSTGAASGKTTLLAAISRHLRLPYVRYGEPADDHIHVPTFECGSDPFTMWAALDASFARSDFVALDSLTEMLLTAGGNAAAGGISTRFSSHLRSLSNSLSRSGKGLVATLSLQSEDARMIAQATQFVKGAVAQLIHVGDFVGSSIRLRSIVRQLDRSQEVEHLYDVKNEVSAAVGRAHARQYMADKF